jgi:hypothetical protein
VPRPVAVSPHPIVITRGECWVFFAFDIGHGVDLDAARQRLPRCKEPPPPGPYSTPAGLQFRLEPLRISEPSAPLPIGSWRTTESVELAIFDFGAVSLAYRVDLAGVGWTQLQSLAHSLDEDRSLLADARRRIADLVPRLGDAVARARLADVVEDYVVFRAHEWSLGPSATPMSELVHAHTGPLAQVLRASPVPLSEYEVSDAMSYVLGFANDDLTVIDWKAAAVFDQDPWEILAVLEFANVELLEMRFVDDRLDAALDRSWQAVSRRRRGRLFPGRAAEERRRIAALQVENALLFEGINNAIKLVGDQYLSRVYRAATRRFHLADWDSSVLRKLDTLQGVYEKVADEHATRRMEILEWIIIALIAVSIAIPFVVGAGK